MFLRRVKPKTTDNIFKEIFSKIYSKLECNIIYVFLCGGKCEENSKEIRNDIKTLLKDLSHNKIEVLYPEELFFNKDRNLDEFFKKRDLLELETILAQNSNIVCIICESYGSATELGAFTNYKEIQKNTLLDKLVAVIYEQFENDQSFINLGPIKRIKSKDKNKFKVYKTKKFLRKKRLLEVKKALTLDLIKEFKRICRKNNSVSDSNRIFLKEDNKLNNFIGLSYLILLLVFFYEKIDNTLITQILKKELSELKIIDLNNKDDISKFDDYFKMSKRFLFEIKEFLLKNKDDSWVLSSKGFTFIKNDILNILKINKRDIDYIRIKILGQQLYNKI